MNTTVTFYRCPKLLIPLRGHAGHHLTLTTDHERENAMSTTAKTPVAKLYAIALKAAADAIGGERAFRIQSSTIRRALVAQAILQVIYGQDQSIRDSTVRELVDGLFEMLIDDLELLA